MSSLCTVSCSRSRSSLALPPVAPVLCRGSNSSRPLPPSWFFVLSFRCPVFVRRSLSQPCSCPLSPPPPFPVPIRSKIERPGCKVVFSAKGERRSLGPPRMENVPKKCPGNNFGTFLGRRVENVSQEAPMEQCLCISWSMAENVLRKLQRNNFGAGLGPMQNLCARKITWSIFKNCCCPGRKVSPGSAQCVFNAVFGAWGEMPPKRIPWNTLGAGGKCLK